VGALSRDTAPANPLTRCTAELSDMAYRMVERFVMGHLLEHFCRLQLISGGMRLKLFGTVVELHSKALQVVQGHSDPPRHSSQPSQPASQRPSLTPVRDRSR